MPNWLRALIAAYGAKKLGGGCLSTIVVFVIIYFALGVCNRPAVRHGDLKSRQQERQAARTVPQLAVQGAPHLAVQKAPQVLDK